VAIAVGDVALRQRGDALFAGLFLLFLATRVEAWNWRRRWTSLAAWMGVAWIILSAWPSLFVQSALLLAALVWLSHDGWPNTIR